MIIVIAAIVVICVGGAAWTGYLLRRDRHLIWRPGNPLPDVPPEAPLRTWQSHSTMRGAPASRSPRTVPVTAPAAGARSRPSRALEQQKLGILVRAGRQADVDCAHGAEEAVEVA